MQHEEIQLEPNPIAFPDLLGMLLEEWGGEEEAVEAPPPLVDPFESLLQQLQDSYPPTEPVEVAAAEESEAEDETETAGDLISMVLAIDERLPELPVAPPIVHTRDVPVNERYIQFWMAGEPFAVPILKVVETGRLADVTTLPCVDESIRGLINLRGEVLPLLDLRQWLGGGEVNGAVGERMVIVRAANSEGACALAVDRVSGIVAIRPEEVQREDASSEDGGAQSISSFCERQGSRIRLLDLERLFAHLFRFQSGRRQSDV